MWKIVSQTKVYFKCTLKLKNTFWGSRVVWILKSFQNKSILKVCFNYNLTSKYYSHQFSVLLLRTQLRSCKHFFRMVKYIAGFYNPGQKSSGQYCDIHIFLSFVGSLLKQCILFEIFLQFSPPPPPPYTKLKLGTNLGYTCLTLLVGWGEGLDLCELENTTERQKCRKTLVHDCLKKRCEEKGSFEGFLSL